MTTISRRIATALFAGAAALPLATLAAPAFAQKGPESQPQLNYQIFHSHVAWHAAAIPAAAQTGSTWKLYSSHIARSNDANWLPIMMPGNVVPEGARLQHEEQKLDLSR